MDFVLTLSEFRRRFARPLFHMNEKAFQPYQQQLGTAEILEPLGMKAGPRGHRNGSAVTPASCTIMLIAGMLTDSRFTIADRVYRRWQARYSGPGGECEVTGATFFGEAVARCLALPELAARVDHIEVTKQFAAGELTWNDRAPASQFHNIDQREFEARTAHVRRPDDAAGPSPYLGDPGVVTIAFLSGDALREVSRWLNTDPAEVPRRRGRAREAIEA